MPWDVKDTMNRREDFVRLAATQAVPFSELCRKYEITRQTGYKWLRRHKAEGVDGLADRSRRPHHSPTRSPERIEALVLDLRRQHGWGGRKIARRLRDLGKTDVPRPPRSPKSCDATGSSTNRRPASVSTGNASSTSIRTRCGRWTSRATSRRWRAGAARR